MYYSLSWAIKSKFRATYDRITLNHITIAFFIFSFVHCFAQGVIQSFLFSIDAEYNLLLSSITSVSAIPAKNMTFLEGSTGNLRLLMCNDVPYGKHLFPCTDIFQSQIDTNNPLVSSAREKAISGGTQGKLLATASRDPTSGNVTGVTLSSGSSPVLLSQQCTEILMYPEQIMQNSKREDLVFVFLQFWLFTISVIAIMYDSVPHTLAVLITRFLITAWSTYAIWRTNFIEGNLTEMIFRDGTPCSINIFPTYFKTRIAYEIPDLVLNVTALLIACYLSSTLLRDYNAQSFKCVGAPRHIQHIHKFFMAVLACLQLEAFVLVAAMSLWLDVLINTAIAHISAHTVIYKGLFIITTILLIPWIVLGWYAIQREMRKSMIAFLGIACFYLAGWSIMFYSEVYRWTFMQWPNLGCFTVASLTLIVATIILGVICRINFGRGLSQYLHAEAVLASSNFAPELFPHDEEKGQADMDVKDPSFFDIPISAKLVLPAQTPEAVQVNAYKAPVPF